MAKIKVQTQSVPTDAMKYRKLQLTISLLMFIQISTSLSTRPKYIVSKVKQTNDNGGDDDETEQDKTIFANTRRLYKTRTSSILATLLQREYDKRVRPDEEEKKMDLGLNVYFNTLSGLDEENMEFDIDFYLRLMWTDPRLNFTHLTNATNTERHILVEPPEQVWIPDVFMENSKHASFHMVTKKNEMLRLWPNGSLFYSVRITAKVSCFMVLYRFPLDEQECAVQFSSYKYTREEIAVSWKKWLNDPLIQVSPNIKLARYTITGVETRKDIVNYGIGGRYDILIAAVRFQRDVGHYILQQYMPCSYIVLLSWVSFWIEADCVGDRISIGVTLVLTIVLLQGSLNTNMPKVSYSKYIDYYFNFCLAFLMGSIIESLVVYKFHKVQQNSVARVLEPRISSQSLFLLRTRREQWNWGSMDERKTPVHPSVRSVVGNGMNNDNNMAEKIDRLSRLVFPVLFTVFNIFYHFYFSIMRP